MLINALQGIETFDFVFWKLIIKKEIKVPPNFVFHLWEHKNFHLFNLFSKVSINCVYFWS